MAAKMAMQAITHATGMKYDCPIVIVPIKTCQFVGYSVQKFYPLPYQIRTDGINDFHQCDKSYHHPQRSRQFQPRKQFISYSQDKHKVCQTIQSGSELTLHSPSSCQKAVEHIRRTCYHVEHPEEDASLTLSLPVTTRPSKQVWRLSLLQALSF